MKRFGKKGIALLLTLALLVQLLPATVFATEAAENSEQDSNASAATAEPEDGNLEAADTQTDASTAQILFEDESLREENVKQFRMSDGSYTAVQYDTAVHYLDDFGAWQDIDNTLQLQSTSSAQTYSAANGENALSFSANLSGGELFTTAYGDYSVQMSLAGTAASLDEVQSGELSAQTQEAEPLQYNNVTAQLSATAAPLSLNDAPEDPFVPETLSASVLYDNVYDGVDLKYEAFGYNVKESIVVNKPLAQYAFSFVLQLGNLTPNLQEDGSIFLQNEQQEIVYLIPAPYMIDALGNTSDAAAYTLEARQNGAYLLKVEADAQWMNAAQFPVAIDPTIYKVQSSTPLLWGFVFSGTPNQAYTDSNAYVGYTSLNNGGEYQILTHINSLPDLPEGSMVTCAQVRLRHSTFSNDSSATYMMLEAHRLTADKGTTQTYNTWLKSLTWNTLHPSGALNYNSNVEDFVKLSNSTKGTYITLDLTRAVRDWYQSSTENRTLLLKSDCSATKRIVSTMYTASSGNYFAVTYRNDFGIESYYTYQTQSAGRAGTGYVSDHMQRLTLVNTLVTSDSNVMPFTLSLVYNSALNGSYFGNASDGYTRDYRNMILGGGWKLSAQQCIQSVRIAGDDTNTLYWVYTDGDGTQHYFYKTSDGSYLDEDGLGLKISLVSETGHTNFKMTDDYGNETFFRDGILTYTKDAYGNGIYYCYNSYSFSSSTTTWQPTNTVYNRLTSIWRLNNGGSAEQLVRFVYDSSNRITGIYNEAGRETLLSYDTSGTVWRLDHLTYPDGAKAEYSYNTLGMTAAYDEEANYGIGYEYDSDGTVSRYYEYYKNGSTQVKGDTVNCWNGNNRSSYRYLGTDQQANTADDLRVEVVFDNWGRTVCTYTTNTDNTQVLGSSAAAYTVNSGTSKQNNRLTEVGSSGMTAVNLLADGGIEKSTDGWTSTSTANANAAARMTNANNEKRRHGTGGLNLYLSSAATSNDYAGIYRTTKLVAGKPYTLSAYFSVNSAMSWPDGAKLELLVQTGSGTTLETHLLTDVKPNASMDGGWQRVSATYTPSTGGNYRFLFKLSGCIGTAYLDDLQLEQADAASTYNLLQNGSFEYELTDDWTVNGISREELPTNAQRFGSHAAKVTGSQDSVRRISRSIPLNCSSDTTFLLSGWALAKYAAPNSVREYEQDSRYFGLIAEIFYSDGAKETQSVPFEWSSTSWQCAVGTIVPKQSGKTISRIIIYCAYDYNSGEAWFDNISLRQEPVQTYSYNENGDVTAATQTGTGTENATYSGVDLTQYTAANGTKYTYTYNDQHDILTASVAGIMGTTGYDTAGNATSSKLTGTGTNLFQQSSAKYTADKNHTASVTDANGNTTTYAYNSATELLGQVTNAAGQATGYSYNKYNYRLTQTYQSGIAAITYGYESGRLQSLDRKTFLTGSDGTKTEQHQFYNFTYNNWGQLLTTAVSGSNSGGTVLATNTYEDYANATGGGNLTKTVFANGQYVTYTYDELDRLIRTEYNSGRYITYAYSAEGQISRIGYGDGGTAKGSYDFEYDSLGRLIRSVEYDGSGTVKQRTEHLYDAYNRLSSQSWILGGTPYTESYTYSDGENGDGSITKMTTATGDTISYTYDGLKRLHTATTANASGTTLFTTAYSYRDLETTEQGVRTTQQVQFRNVRNAAGTLLEGKKYTYDALGNIIGIYESTDLFRQLVAYTYDSQNQLLSETYYTYSGTSTTPATTTVYEYTYDTAGNILTASKNGTVTQTYTYGNTQWRDLLTAVNGNAISYDASGNPLTYGDWGFTWQNGRQLFTAASSTDTTDTELSYAYDADGIRTSKTVTVSTYEDIPQYTVTFVADGVTVKTMTVDDGYTLKNSDYPSVPAKSGFTGSWTRYLLAIHSNITITAKYTLKSGGDTTIPVPTQPTIPSDIMSEGEEPLEAEAEPLTAEAEAEVQTSSTHTGQRLVSTQTISHEYLTQSGRVMRETITSGADVTVLDFIYDESGKPFVLKYSEDGGTNFEVYYYILNLQGDVVGLTDANGNFVAQYTYDAWGNLLSSSGGKAEINPLRYRGYYYDTETGFYYLQSRYYDPANHRFINADVYASTDSTDAISCNMFAYCANNPVMRADPTGDAWWHWVVATVAVAALVVASVVTCGGAAAAAATATAIVTGTCTTVSTAATIVTGAAVGAGVAYAGAVATAASDSNSLDEFADYGATALEATVEGGIWGGVAGYANSKMSCFVAGTPVLTNDGSKAIECIRAGDLVWAWDEGTGDVALKEVVETYVNETTELTHIFVGGEEILCTPTHPFYCPVKGWTDAAQLRAGDILVLVNGEYVVVEKVQHELLESPVKVYNFQVEDYHTYYVADSGILVHNSCNHNSRWDRERQRYWRDAGKTAELGSNYGSYTATVENIDRMLSGKAPIGWDGASVQLHHWAGIANDFYNYSPVSRTLHKIIHYLAK